MVECIAWAGIGIGHKGPVSRVPHLPCDFKALIQFVAYIIHNFIMQTVSQFLVLCTEHLWLLMPTLTTNSSTAVLFTLSQQVTTPIMMFPLYTFPFLLKAFLACNFV